MLRTSHGTEPLVAIDRLTFSVMAGEIACIVGRTGCGKSTFLNILAGLDHPTEGEITIGENTPYNAFDLFKGAVAVIFQQDRLLPWRTARENVELGLEILGISPGQRRETAEEWLTRLELSGFLNAYPGELSGGMRQRVAMARAFALDPQLLLVDEAFGHLDEVTARQLRVDFLKHASRRGTTVVMVTHQLEEAIETAEKIFVFGKPARLLAEIDTPAALSRMSKEELRTFIQETIDSNQPRQL
ncbi:MAG: ATP-binding cassette domain-containing protein [Acidobacteria bacterium]|nr:ATP-binding cassette domain-containing protein [Acidobacteriota bacterium]